MTKPKKLFVGLSLVFLLLLAWASFDIASKTTFPGSKPQLKERIKKQFADTTKASKDSTGVIHR